MKKLYLFITMITACFSSDDLALTERYAFKIVSKSGSKPIVIEKTPQGLKLFRLSDERPFGPPSLCPVEVDCLNQIEFLSSNLYSNARHTIRLTKDLTRIEFLSLAVKIGGCEEVGCGLSIMDIQDLLTIPPVSFMAYLPPAALSPYVTPPTAPSTRANPPVDTWLHEPMLNSFATTI